MIYILLKILLAARRRASRVSGQLADLLIRTELIRPVAQKSRWEMRLFPFQFKLNPQPKMVLLEFGLWTPRVKTKYRNTIKHQ